MGMVIVVALFSSPVDDIIEKIVIELPFWLATYMVFPVGLMEKCRGTLMSPPPVSHPTEVRVPSFLTDQMPMELWPRLEA